MYKRQELEGMEARLAKAYEAGSDRHLILNVFHADSATLAQIAAFAASAVTNA